MCALAVDTHIIVERCVIEEQVALITVIPHTRLLEDEQVSRVKSGCQQTVKCAHQRGKQTRDRQS